jgi:hypothetical protein
MYQRWIVWTLFASVMGFALGGSAFWGLYGPNITIQRASQAAEHDPSHHEAKSKKEETDEAIAYYTLWLTVFTSVLAFATIALGGATFGLYLTGEKQIKFLRESSEAQFRDMQESLGISRAAAKAATEAAYSERAWVSPDTVDAGRITNLIMGDEHYAEGLGAIVTWKNAGRSPAIHLAVITMGKIVPLGDPPPIFDGNVPNILDARAILGPTLAAKGEMPYIYGDDLAKFKDRELSWYIFSQATYNTVFEPEIRRVSQLCVRAEWNGDIVNPDGSTRPHISFAAMGPQNTAD